MWLPPRTPDGKPGQLHLSSDASGDSAIFQYVGAKLQIYHDRSYQVMTNSPTFDKQLALNDYWEEIGGLTMLPGTNRSADRFARASFMSRPPAKDRPGQRGGGRGDERDAQCLGTHGDQHPGSAPTSPPPRGEAWRISSIAAISSS